MHRPSLPVQGSREPRDPYGSGPEANRPVSLSRPSPRCTEPTSPSPSPPPHTPRVTDNIAPECERRPPRVSLPSLPVVAAAVVFTAAHSRARLGGEERNRPPINAPRPPPQPPQLNHPKPTTARTPISPRLHPRSFRLREGGGARGSGPRGGFRGCTSTTRGCRRRWRQRRAGRRRRSRARCGRPPTRGGPATPTPPTPRSSGSPCSTCNCLLLLPSLRLDCF